jgi:hypothetical protein
METAEWFEIGGMNIPQVRLSYCMSWYDFNIDDRPEPILIWEKYKNALETARLVS